MGTMSHFICNGKLFRGSERSPLRDATEVELEFHEAILALERKVDDAWELARQLVKKLEE